MNEAKLAEYLDSLLNNGAHTLKPIYCIPKPMRKALSDLMVQHWYNVTHERFANFDDLFQVVGRDNLIAMITSYKEVPFLNLHLRRAYDKIVNRKR